MMETSIKRDDTRQARMTKTSVVRELRSMVAMMDAYDLRESLRFGAGNDCVNRLEEIANWIETTKLLPADAVGRGRVREAGIDEQALEAAAKALWEAEYNGAPWTVVDARVQRKYGSLAASVITAYLAAAPPERHDAPGVTVDEFEELLQEYSVLTDVVSRLLAKRQPTAREKIDALATDQKVGQLRERLVGLYRDALSGQPDAGRDPDAADAGGES